MQSELRQSFDEYLSQLCHGVGYARRHRNLKDYCTGLMMPLERKSVEPMAAAIAPDNVRQRHQGLHHFVADAPWSDQAVLKQVHDWVLPSLLEGDETPVWIVDDTGLPKKGTHSVGVARQYCGQLGKRENCQVVVSLSVGSEKGSLPLAYQLYLPEPWCTDEKRRKRCGVPEEIAFQSKPQIALAQLRDACQVHEHRGVVLSDSAYGNSNEYRDGLESLGLEYLVEVKGSTTLWPQGVEPLPPKTRSKTGPTPKRLRYAPGHEPVSIQAYCESLDGRAWKQVTWREGSNASLRSRFVAKRVRVAHRDYNRHMLRESCWLLAEWLEGQESPSQFWLGNLKPTLQLQSLVCIAKKRWRIERDYQELKQEFGLNHYEGRGWRGLHHHWTLCVAAYGFTVWQQIRHPKKKKDALRQEFAISKEIPPRGSAAYAEARH